jgi:hypothetical protein
MSFELLTAFEQDVREMLFHHTARQAELFPDLVHRAAIPVVQHKCGPGIARESGKRTIERLKMALAMHLRYRVGLNDELRFIECVHDIHSLWNHLAQGVLMQHVARDGQEIRLRVADLILTIDAQQAKKNLLGEIRDVGGIAQPGGEKAAQATAIASLQIDDKGLRMARGQVGSAA